jgi:hypothetical protein
MQNALEQIKRHAETQGLKLEELISTLPPQADPAIIRLQERLVEQIQLSSIGKVDPQGFRLEIRDRQHGRKEPKQPGKSNGSELTPTVTAGTPLPAEGSKGNGNDMSRPTDVPGKSGSGKGQGQSTPGNGNHPNPTHNPAP